MKQYYLMMAGDTEQDAWLETNLLGEDNGFGVFWAGAGLRALMNIVEKHPEYLEGKVLDIITDKLLKSLKDELDKEKNKVFIENELLKPIIHKILEQLYPYFIGASFVIAFIVISVFVILCLNLKICYF